MQEKNAVGRSQPWPFWLSTAPMPLPEASVCKIKDLSQSGHPSTGSLVRAFLSAMKSCCSSLVQLTLLGLSFRVDSEVGS